MATPRAVPFSNSSNLVCSHERVPSAIARVSTASTAASTMQSLRMISTEVYQGSEFRVDIWCRVPSAELETQIMIAARRRYVSVEDERTLLAESAEIDRM